MVTQEQARVCAPATSGGGSGEGMHARRLVLGFLPLQLPATAEERNYIWTRRKPSDISSVLTESTSIAVQ